MLLIHSGTLEALETTGWGPGVPQVALATNGVSMASAGASSPLDRVTILRDWRHLPPNETTGRPSKQRGWATASDQHQDATGDRRDYPTARSIRKNASTPSAALASSGTGPNTTIPGSRPATTPSGPYRPVRVPRSEDAASDPHDDRLRHRLTLKNIRSAKTLVFTVECSVKHESRSRKLIVRISILWERGASEIRQAHRSEAPVRGFRRGIRTDDLCVSQIEQLWRTGIHRPTGGQ